MAHRSVALLTVSLILAVPGCVPDEAAAPDATVIEITEDRAREIVTSPSGSAYFALLHYRTEAVASAIQRGVQRDRLRRAVEADDRDWLATELFGSVEAGTTYAERLEEARVTFVNAHAEVRQVVENPGTQITACDQPEDRAATLMVASLAAEPTCGSYWQQAKLLVCTAASGAVCGPGSLMRAWGCWCTLCSDNSELADLMC